MSTITTIPSYDAYPEPEIRPFQNKSTAVGQQFVTGQIVAYNEANDNWEKAVSGSGSRLGICTTNKLISQTKDEQTGEVIQVVGAPETDPTFSLMVSGRYTKQVEGTIVSGNNVKVAATDPNRVMEWNSAVDDASLVLGDYIINITQKHEANIPPPTAADGDWIKIALSKENLG